MATDVEPLILDLVEWVAKRPRPYAELMAAWRTANPRLPVWEETVERRYVTQERVPGRGIWVVAATPEGRHVLRAQGRLDRALAQRRRRPPMPHDPWPATEPDQLSVHVPVGSICVRSVKRVVDYIQVNADRPLTLADLVAASGVAGRTLHSHFRLSKGTTPMAYLRSVRLQRVRADLLRDDGASVSAVAMRWGFAHLGRFAAQYRGRFGEAPSETRRRGWGTYRPCYKAAVRHREGTSWRTTSSL